MEICYKVYGVVQNCCRLFLRAAADGRGERLFGRGTLDKAIAALRKGAIPGAERGASFYFEFPFTGAPRMDLMVAYDCAKLHAPIAFEEGDGYGLQDFFAACAADAALSKHICGFSFDISDMADKSSAAEANPGVYLLPDSAAPNVEYVPAMLSRLCEEERVARVMAAFAAAPSLWQPYYAGYMPGRRGAPTRIGFLVPPERSAHYARSPEQLVEDVQGFAGICLSGEGRKDLLALAGSGAVFDLQFDFCPDGTFTDDLGVSLRFGFSETNPRDCAGVLEKGKAGEMMARIEAMGLADDRWRLMDKACYAVSCFVRGAEGELLRVGDTVSLNAVKVRFKRGAAHLAKGYLLARSSVLLSKKGELQ